jgi:splicing factor 3A subunit 2
MAHTQGKRHQLALSVRAERDAKYGRRMMGNAPGGSGAAAAAAATAAAKPTPKPFVKVGRPGYRVVKFVEGATGGASGGGEEQKGLLFELHYPEIEAGLQPRHSMMSSFAQHVEKPDKNFQYLLFAARPYETVAFKIPNLPLDNRPGKFSTSWNKDAKMFTLRLCFKSIGDVGS